MKIRFTVLIALTALLCLGCLFSCGKSGENQDTETDTSKETAKDTERPDSRFDFDGWYSLSEDKSELRVKFDANITTGFNWFVENSNEKIIKSSFEDYVTDPVEDGEILCGVGGTWMSAFVPGEETGDVTLTFRYQQEWEFDSETWDKKLDLHVENGTVAIVNEYSND